MDVLLERATPAHLELEQDLEDYGQENRSLRQGRDVYENS